MGAENLPPETGVRLSIGPWYYRESTTSKTELELLFFSEESKNTPIQVGVSPYYAKTLPLGGVWNRGLSFNAKAKRGQFKFTQSTTLQNALNQSEVSWQRGRQTPGRPDWVIETQVEYQRGSYSAGITYHFESSSPMDLSGLWSKPSQHQLGAQVGYEKKNWAIKLLAKNILFHPNFPNNPEFQGTAQPNLIEPPLEGTEVRLLCEILL